MSPSTQARLNNMEKLKSHPVLKGLFKKLTQAELCDVTHFIMKHGELDADAYAHHCNRWYLDQPKPKHYSDMWAIVSQSNTEAV